jgi:thiamine-phosphate pyrophosphorylase
VTALDLSLYVVLDTALCPPNQLASVAAAAARGGAGIVQLRDKTGDTAARVEATRALKAALAGSGVPVIVNDDVEAALAAEADGLHVGQGDLPPSAARARIGPGKLLGLSVETVAHARAVDPALVDHVGAGPVLATATKPDHAAPTGFDGLAEMVAASPVPAVAIGGMAAPHASAAIAAGAAGLAVVSAVCAAADPEAAARAIGDAVRRARMEANR